MRNSIFNHAKDSPKPVKNKMGRKMLVQTSCIKVIFFSSNGSSKLVQTSCVLEKLVQTGPAPFHHGGFN